ncbi:MAG: STAS domain-containing protein [Myxococcota bacterium]
MSVASRKVGDVSVIDLRGSVDAAALRAIEPRLLALADRPGAKLAVDLRQVTSMDSSGLGMLLALTKRARANDGNVVLFGVPSSVKTIFRVTGISRVIDTFDEEHEALGALGS